MEDLSWIINKNSMFANKFESATSPEALDCLEQWHRNKVLNQADVPIEPSWLLATQRNWNDSYSDMRSGAWNHHDNLQQGPVIMSNIWQYASA